EEPLRAGIALATGATTQLVIDAACLVALGAEYVQTAQQAHPVCVSLNLRVGQLPRRLALLGRCFLEGDALFAEIRLDQAIGISAQQDVDTTASHVRRDRYRARPTRLGDYPRLPLVLLGVE